MKLIFCTILSFICFLTYGQVEISNSIILNSADSAKRQISNTSYPIDSADAINVNTVAYSYLRYYQASGTNNISITTNIALQEYGSGMTFLFKVTSSNTDSVMVNIDGLGAKRLLTIHNQRLKFGDLVAGNIHTIVYNGLYFVLLSDTDRGCLNGFVEVNETYCIEITDRPAVLFYDATKVCQDMNAKICTWGEWYYACQKSGLGLINMVNNYEFIDDAHDHGTFVGMVGGGGVCNLFTSLNAGTALRPYRCCYRK
ncbi:MAG TPA: hypothetical protein VK177_02710 [Flavobacteriales bacterium]|nr:hypothetical protein [Flavobacteriales bacterium]